MLFGAFNFLYNKYICSMINFFKNKIIPSIKRPRIIAKVILIFLALVTLYRIVNLVSNDNWKRAKGAEYYWIAQSIAKDHGYSFSANHRWLFVDFISKYSTDKYYPTAWEEPIYPYMLGLCMKYFGEYGRLIILILQILALYITAMLIYMVIRKVYNSDLGIIMSFWLLMRWPDIRSLSEHIFSPAIFAGLGIIISVFLFFWFIEKTSVKRGIVLGIVLGVVCLTRATALLIVPIMILLTFYFNRKSKLATMRPILGIALSFIVIISPWIIRNYLVFGQIIPFRNGVGQGLHMSNPMVAATFSHEDFAHENTLGPIWHAKNAGEALRAISRNKEKRSAIYKRAFDCIKLEAPDNYEQFNEAQRDKFYLKRGIDFIAHNPVTFLTLTYYRTKMFLRGWQRWHTIISVLAIIGILLSFKSPKVLTLALVTAGYIFTYSLIGAWFYRYRYPIEPILFVLASGLPIFVYNKIKSKFISLNPQSVVKKFSK